MTFTAIQLSVEDGSARILQAIDRFRQPRRMEFAARHPGMRTGSCSMPRTKLE